MRSRTFMSVIIGIILFGSILLRMINPIFVDILTVVIMIFSGLEMAKAISNKFAQPFFLLVALFPVFAFGAFFGGEYIEFLGGLTCVFILVILIFAIMFLAKAINPKIGKDRIMSTFFVIVYPMTLASFLFALNRTGFAGTPVALLFAITCLSDTFAFLIGITFKGPKLAPKISPKKTVSGAIGGLIGGIAGAALVVLLSNFNLIGLIPVFTDMSYQIVFVVVAGIIGSVFTQAGDMVASIVKRKMEIKDYGTILGGHGGVMDRVDGQIFNMVFIYILFTVIRLFAGN